MKNDQRSTVGHSNTASGDEKKLHEPFTVVFITLPTKARCLLLLDPNSDFDSQDYPPLNDIVKSFFNYLFVVLLTHTCTK